MQSKSSQEAARKAPLVTTRQPAVVYPAMRPGFEMASGGGHRSRRREFRRRSLGFMGERASRILRNREHFLRQSSQTGEPQRPELRGPPRPACAPNVGSTRRRRASRQRREPGENLVRCHVLPRRQTPGLMVHASPGGESELMCSTCTQQTLVEDRETRCNGSDLRFSVGAAGFEPTTSCV